VEPLFSSIKKQKDNLISIISQAQEVQEDLTENTPEPGETQKQVQALVDEFTKTTTDLSHQVDLLGRLIAEHHIPTES
jgi:ribonuclease D